MRQIDGETKRRLLGSHTPGIGPISVGDAVLVGDRLFDLSGRLVNLTTERAWADYLFTAMAHLSFPAMEVPAEVDSAKPTWELVLDAVVRLHADPFCPERKGIVRRLLSLVWERGSNRGIDLVREPDWRILGFALKNDPALALGVANDRKTASAA